MKNLSKDQKYMQRCIAIAKNGIATASPNPSVGAVLVYLDNIIGEGFTSAFGGNHAEVNCINSVSKENRKHIQESTLYVSLEPCSHQGKTPACSHLLVKQNIQKVVIGSRDPNPLVAGKGIAMLMKNNVEVCTGIMEDECKEANKRFYTFYEKKRPYIILKWAETKDHFFAPETSSKYWISNKYTKQLVHKWRSEEMSILVGTNTAKIDNPRLNARLFSGKNPTRILIDRSLKLDNKLALFNQKQKTIVFNESQNSYKENLEHIAINFEQNVIRQILQELYLREINSLIVEGGVATIDYFIKENMWDEARILTGSKRLNVGIHAPKIKAQLINSYNIKEDRIEILRNKQL